MRKGIGYKSILLKQNLTNLTPSKARRSLCRQVSLLSLCELRLFTYYPLDPPAQTSMRTSPSRQRCGVNIQPLLAATLYLVLRLGAVAITHSTSHSPAPNTAASLRNRSPDQTSSPSLVVPAPPPHQPGPIMNEVCE